ncbi:gmc oxidoreductase [Colletotrichum camelliae]|nr:gmc oxidoreductase [Colletotrichum camelliae]
MKLLSFTSLLLFSSSVAGSPFNDTAYDYVVVGSGPGGGPLAASLAREGHSVFLIEAGGNMGDTNLQRIPGLADINSEDPEMSWQFFVSHYQNETQARRDRYFTYRLSNGTLWYGLDPPEDATPLGIYYPRGATVGGSAIANAMNVVLPPDSDWSHFAEVTGDEAWGPENMRSMFIELERNTYVPKGTPSHGFDGYISTNLNNISYVVDRPGVLRVVQNTISGTEGIDTPGYEQVVELMERDLNRVDSDRYEIPGLYQIPLHVDENRRRSSPWNFIAETLASTSEDGKPRYPLTLSTHSLATRVLTEKSGSGLRAYGVEYMVAEEGLYEADKRYDPSIEPQLRTWNWTSTRVERFGIPVVAELPAVGEFLQDNYEIDINVRSNIVWENSPFAECTLESPETDPCLAQWEAGYGAYGEAAAPIFGLYRSNHSRNADTDLIFFGGAGGVFDGHYPGFSEIAWPPTSFFWAAVKMQNGNPTGTVRLRSSNPRETPEINLNFFQEDSDVDIAALSEGLNHLMSILNATGEPYQPFEVIDPPADRSLEQHIRDHTFSHHVAGSCRMGKSSSDSCVDSKFRVHGVQGLRVVDGSVFPRVPGGFPVGATYAASRKAFHDIVNDSDQ